MGCHSINPETADIVDTAQFCDAVMKEEMTPLPREFNVPWQEDHIRRTEVGRQHTDALDYQQCLVRGADVCSERWHRSYYPSYRGSCDM